MAKAVDHKRELHSLAGVGSLGLLIGLLVGLSASPVVGSLLGTLATLAVTLVGSGLRLPGIRKTAEEAQAPPADGPPAAGWLMALCLCTIVGVLAGIWVRTHNALSPSLKEQVQAYQQAGFTLPEAKEALMQRLVAASETGTTPADLSALFANRQAYDLDEFNPERIRSAEETVNTWRGAGAPPLIQSLAQEIDKIDFSPPTQKLEVLQAIWNAMEAARKDALKKEANQ